MGCFLLAVSALNTGPHRWPILAILFNIWLCLTRLLRRAGYSKRLEHWAVCGGRKPRYRWLGVAPRSLPFWAGVVYTAGGHPGGAAVLQDVSLKEPLEGAPCAVLHSRLLKWGTQCTGAVLYNIGCTTNLADQFESVSLSPVAQVHLALCFQHYAAVHVALA